MYLAAIAVVAAVAVVVVTITIVAAIALVVVTITVVAAIALLFYLTAAIFVRVVVMMVVMPLRSRMMSSVLPLFIR